jgi:hypothetical protein
MGNILQPTYTTAMFSLAYHGVSAPRLAELALLALVALVL